MEVFFLPKEAVLLEFKRVNGSGWLTNYRLCSSMPSQALSFQAKFGL